MKRKCDHLNEILQSQTTVELGIELENGEIQELVATVDRIEKCSNEEIYVEFTQHHNDGLLIPRRVAQDKIRSILPISPQPSPCSQAA